MQLLRTCVGQCFSECAICLLRFLKLFFFFLLFFFLSLVLKKEEKQKTWTVESNGRVDPSLSAGWIASPVSSIRILLLVIHRCFWLWW